MRRLQSHAAIALAFALAGGVSPGVDLASSSESQDETEKSGSLDPFAYANKGNIHIGGKVHFYKKRSTTSRSTTSGNASRNTEITQEVSCYFGDPSHAWAAYSCQKDWSAVLRCEDSQSVALPTGRRVYNPTTKRWGDWQQASELRCVGGEGAPAQAASLQQAVERAFASLPIPPSQLEVQPANGWNFVNTPTIVYTDPAPQTLTTTLLDTAIDIEVTPASFTWDFNDPDAAPLTTTDPGAPYPNHTVSHTYTATGSTTITLTTTWTGRFRTTHDPAWIPITGHATTTTQTPPLELIQAQAHLTK